MSSLLRPPDALGMRNPTRTPLMRSLPVSRDLKPICLTYLEEELPNPGLTSAIIKDLSPPNNKNSTGGKDKLSPAIGIEKKATLPKIIKLKHPPELHQATAPGATRSI